MKFLSLVATYTPPDSGTAPPGSEGLNMIVSWIIWGVAAILFIYFVVGLSTAARARNNGGQADVSAPIWPLICAIILGAAGTIWAVIG